MYKEGAPGGSHGKESTYSTEDLALILESGRSLGEGHGKPLQYSCLENPMDRGAWRATVHRVAKSWTHRVGSDFAGMQCLYVNLPTVFNQTGSKESNIISIGL